MPAIPVKIMLNVANPDRAFDFASLPHRGVGLARLEFIINRTIGVHPRALLEFASLEPGLQAKIRQHIGPDVDPVELLRRPPSRGDRNDRLRVRAGAGDRSPVGLQVQ